MILLMKKLYYSEHTKTRNSGHTFRKPDLASKGELLPGLTKMSVKPLPTGPRANNFTRLAGKSKMTPPKKTATDANQRTTSRS